jgi:hypothetical protein
MRKVFNLTSYLFCVCVRTDPNFYTVIICSPRVVAGSKE